MFSGLSTELGISIYHYDHIYWIIYISMTETRPHPKKNNQADPSPVEFKPRKIGLSTARR